MRLRFCFCAAYLWLASASVAFAQSVISIETAHDADSSAIVAHSFAAQESVRALGRVGHQRDMAPMGTLSHDGRTLALMNVGTRGEPRRHADLLVFDLASGQTRVLVQGLQQVPAAFSAEDREIFAVRSEALPPPSEEETRHGRLEDERLTVLAIDVQSGRVREVAHDISYMVHPIGIAHSGELIAIRAAWSGGSLIAIDTSSGRARTLVRSPIDAFRDASLSADGFSVVVLRRAPASHGEVIRVHIEDAVVETLAQNLPDDAAPLAFGNDAALMTRSHTDVQMLGASSSFTLWSTENAHWLRALATSRDGALIVLQSIGGTPSHETLVLHTGTGACAPLTVPRNVVVHIAGIQGAPR